MIIKVWHYNWKPEVSFTQLVDMMVQADYDMLKMKV